MNNEHKEHILPVKTYLAVAAALFIFTGITMAVSYLDLGGWNAIVAILIASIKVSLVAMFFMHLKYESKIHLFVFLTGITFVTLFIALTMFDTLRRADIYDEVGSPINKQAIIYEKAASDSTQQAGEEHKSQAGAPAKNGEEPTTKVSPDSAKQSDVLHH